MTRPEGIVALRDGAGHFAVLRCVNGHDRCYLGTSDDCPTCERTCRRCRALQSKDTRDV